MRSSIFGGCDSGHSWGISFCFQVNICDLSLLALYIASQINFAALVSKY